MKIIAVDNYDRDHVSDYLVCNNIGKYYGEKIAELLNQPPSQDRFYKLVEDDHKLHDGSSVY